MSDFYMDAHMHFDLYKDRNKILSYIEQKRSYTIAVTNLPDIYKQYLGIDEKYKFTKIALGYHPELVKDFPDQVDIFIEMLPFTRYIGEIGIDGTIRDRQILLRQEHIFDKILETASGEEKILSVHSRRASKEVMKHLTGFDGKVILHWFSGRLQDLEEAVDRGYFFSINPQMLKSKAGETIVSRIPIHRILLESDAPFINELKKEYSVEFNDYIYQYFAAKYNVPYEQVMMRVKANFAEVIKKDKKDE